MLEWRSPANVHDDGDLTSQTQKIWKIPNSNRNRLTFLGHLGSLCISSTQFFPILP